MKYLNWWKIIRKYFSILIYDGLHKTLIDAKSLRIRFGKIDGFIRVYDGTRYLVLFGGERYDFICKWIRYLIGVKSGSAYIISHNYAEIKVDSYDSVLLGKTKTFHDVIVFTKSVFNRDKNNSYFNIFLQKDSHELSKKQVFG